MDELHLHLVGELMTKLAGHPTFGLNALRAHMKPRDAGGDVLYEDIDEKLRDRQLRRLSPELEWAWRFDDQGCTKQFLSDAAQHTGTRGERLLRLARAAEVAVEEVAEEAHDALVDTPDDAIERISHEHKREGAEQYHDGQYHDHREAEIVEEFSDGDAGAGA